MSASGRPLFVTGIGTGVGKTVVSAIICQALGADYWKPVQAGDLERSDSDAVRALVTCPPTVVHPERYRLTQAMSPHSAARIDGVRMALSDFALPETSRPLVVEGAGGIMVPLSDDALILDLIVQLGADVVVVSKHYLGSINHTLLTLDALRSRDVRVRGVMFNGEANPDTEIVIAARGNVAIMGRVAPEAIMDAAAVSRNAAALEGTVRELV